MPNVVLPSMPKVVQPAISDLATALRLSRSVLASEDDIENAWSNLPRELALIPSELRDELIARMCVAVSAGLFDGAMNYIWNAAILHLRTRIRNFGLQIVAQILQSDFEEKNLLSTQDNQLLELCLKLNLINEDGFFFLDQCRSVRNNFSAAHPTMGTVNDREFITFLNRCVRYALAETTSLKGVDISAFISAIKGNRFVSNQKDIWVERLKATHDAQRQLLLGMVHGIYCDPSSSEPSRLNSLDLCDDLKAQFTSAIRADLISKHGEYSAKGDEPRHGASTQFFEKLGLLRLLNESERHTVFYKAIERLWQAHCGMNNFYNEAPFAERLKELAQQSAIPETAQLRYVEVLIACRLGNGYGVARSACPDYDDMISGFSPREITTMLNILYDQNSTISKRLSNNSSCRQEVRSLIRLIDEASVPSGVRTAYETILNM